MAKRGRHSFIKFQKELKRKKKAEEKLAKRLAKKDNTPDIDVLDDANDFDTDDIDEGETL
jgi:hypothetical protein